MSLSVLGSDVKNRITLLALSTVMSPRRAPPSGRLHSARTSKGERDGEGRGREERNRRRQEELLSLLIRTRGITSIPEGFCCSPLGFPATRCVRTEDVGVSSRPRTQLLFLCIVMRAVWTYSPFAKCGFAAQLSNRHLVQMEKQPPASRLACCPWRRGTSRAWRDLENVTPVPV